VDGTALVDDRGPAATAPATTAEPPDEEARGETEAQKVIAARRAAVERREAEVRRAGLESREAEAKRAKEIAAAAPPVAPAAVCTSASDTAEEPLDLDRTYGATAPRAAPNEKKKFSETQWFMKSIKPEELEEVGAGDDLEASTRRYEGTTPVEDSVREKFSLADAFRHHAAKGRKPTGGEAFLNLDEKQKARAKKRR